MNSSPTPSVALDWRWCRFDELSVHELQYIYMARQQVFGVEQNCAYHPNYARTRVFSGS